MINAFLGPYRFLSNFWPVEIKYEDRIYLSVEHAYQAAKTEDDTLRAQIQNTPSPGAAKRIGGYVMLRPHWNSLKLLIMNELLFQKFDPIKNPSLHRMLMRTGTQELVEGNTWGDRFWGVCDGEGENHLGKLLMRVRNSFIET